MTLQATKELVDQDKKWYLEARVEKHDNESTHWEIGPEGHIYLSCKTLRSNTPVTAILNGGAGKTGVWCIPEEGTEVAIGFDDGEFEGDAFILAIHGHPPSGMAAGKVIIIGTTVEVRSENGTAVSLATKADVQNLRDFINDTMVITCPAGTSTPGTTGTPSPSGTDVLKGE